MFGILTVLLLTFGCLGPNPQTNVNNTHNISGNLSNVVNDTKVNNENGNQNVLSIAMFEAETPVIEKGKSTVLRWNVVGASDVILEGVGNVALQGSMVVMPEKTTMYKLIAVDSDGNKTASVNVIVKEPMASEGNQSSGTLGEENNDTTIDNEGSNRHAGTLAYVCGDGVCDDNENTTTCCYDCGCSKDYYCEENMCVPNSEEGGSIKENGTKSQEGNNGSIQWYDPHKNIVNLGNIKYGFCGDGICTGSETTANCCEDCGCNSVTQYCSNNTCKIMTVSGTLLNTVSGNGGLGMINLGTIHMYGVDKKIYSANTNHLSSVEFVKDGTKLKISLVFKSTSKLSDMVKSDQGPKIYFDTNFDGSADFVASIRKAKTYIWSKATGNNVYVGSTVCSSATCSFDMVWNSVFGSKKHVNVWLGDIAHKERVPVYNALRLDWSPFNISKAHANEDPYILLTIDKIKVYNDGDSIGEGEIMFFGSAKSGSKETKLGFPAKIWYELTSGTTIMAQSDERLPLFAAKESEMGDQIYFLFGADDNDDLPGLLKSFIDVLSGRVTAKLFGKIIPGMSMAQKMNVLGNTAYQFAHAVSRADYIGEVHGILEKENGDWKFGTWTEHKGGIGVTYTLRRVWVPRKLHAMVNLYGIRIDDSSDSNWHCCSKYTVTGGEFYSIMRVGTDFKSDGTLDSQYTRYPKHGTTCVCNNWVKCPAYDKNKFGTRPESKTIYSGEVKGPFVYIEIGNWDEDNPSIGDDDDPLGIWDYTYLMDESSFNWYISSNKPKRKDVDTMRTKHGISGGTSTIDMRTTVWQQ